MKKRAREARKRSGQTVTETPHTISAVFELINEGLVSLTDPREPTLEMKHAILRPIIEGKVLAHGLLMKPQLGDEPERIPAHLFKGSPKIDWRRGTLENLGRRYEIVEASRADTNRPRAETSKPINKRGRRSVTEEISNVVRKLVADKAFAGKLEKQKVALIQKACREHYPDRFPRGPSESKVREVLKALGL